MSKLAIYGGPKTIQAGEIKPWPPIDRTDEELVLNALHAEKQARGDHNIALEQEFAAWNGSRYALFTNSGTAALHLGLVGCGVGAGDHVLVTAYSWSSSATCILHHDAIPIFVDIDFDTMNMDIDKIEAAITPRTKAIVAVNLHGLSLDFDRLLAVARRHHLKVVEDCCQSHGALFKGRKVGTFGDAAAFSFNQNKCMCCGEGGMFVTNDEQVYQQASQLWSFGETRRPEQSRDYHAYALGWMYRNNELTAAFARAQLAKYPHHFEILRANGAVLNRLLPGTPALILPVEPPGHTHNWYNYNLRIDFEAAGWTGDKRQFRAAVNAALNAEGVPTAVWQQFILPEMTVFQARNAYGDGYPWSIPGANEGVDYNPARFPVAQRHCESYMALVMALRAPNGPDLAERIAGGIRKVFENIGQIDPDRILK
jgi:dTDP-4-amino-4,6-dideoxygalactose transaminase